MSTKCVSCKNYQLDYFVIPSKYGKETYSKLAKKLEGEWIPNVGWKIHYDKQDKFKDIMDVAFSEVRVKFEARPEKPKTVDVAKSDNEEEEKEEEEEVESRNKFRRARSAGRDDKNKKSDPLKFYYNKFKTEPDEFSKLVFDDEEIHLSDSSSDDDSDSSEDFPNRSPKRQALVSDDTIDKMEQIRRRMIEMDLKDKKKQHKTKS